MQIADKLEKVLDSSLIGGTHLTPDGVEFALFSRNATKVELCLFDDEDLSERSRYTLYPHEDHIWRGFLPGGFAGLKYGYRVHGPYEPEQGHRFNPHKLLVDPFARELTGPVINHASLFAEHGDDGQFSTRDSAPFVPKCIVRDEQEGLSFVRPDTSMSGSVIYELHVAGFTRLNRQVPSTDRGTFAGLSSGPSLKHFKELGITAVELMPVHAFNDEPHLWAQDLSNYWGYNPYSFFAPDPRYGDPRQFRDMVQRFHDAGIEVILDVVYNHTGEGDRFGPTLSLRGIDNKSYYRSSPDDPGQYENDTGCGNTLATEHPYVEKMVLASLRYWAAEMGVDGFRFDLAPILGRSRDGYSSEAPFFKALQADPVLSKLKLIAEPWDIGYGGYQLGNFPLGWSEWNDKYRDSVRAFWRGDDHTIGELAGRLSGSRDLFDGNGRRPQAGINFIASHDGFTLQDIVTYNEKHNEANGEDNRDGHQHNLSHNYGTEGETDQVEVVALRKRQKRNLLATLFLSQGVPMLQAGDELGRTQKGNNNAYCQDNAINWLDWDQADFELAAFVQKLIALRKRFPQLKLDGFLTGEAALAGELNDITWLSPQGEPMQPHDWELPYARCFGFYLRNLKGGESEGPLLVILNAHHEPLEFSLPSNHYASSWTCLLDTADELTISGSLQATKTVLLPSHSLIILQGVKRNQALDEDYYHLSDLCEIVGLEQNYTDLYGQTHHLNDEDRKLFLEAFDLDVSSDKAIDQAVREYQEKQWRRVLEPVIVLRKPDGQGVGLDRLPFVQLCSTQMHQDLHWQIDLDKGNRLQGEIDIDGLLLMKSVRVGDYAFYRLELPLPRDLPFGYHQIDISIGATRASASLIIAPMHCYKPPFLKNGERIWGIAHQLYALKRAEDPGIGDFADLDNLVYAAAKSGADILGLNPLHALFPAMPERTSPYSPSSRLYLNPIYLDVSRIEGFNEKMAAKNDRGRLVDYENVSLEKELIFKELYQYYLDKSHKSEREEFNLFCQSKGESLISFARFNALQSHFDGKSTLDWPMEFQDCHEEAVEAFALDNVKAIDYQCWLQWQIERQLSRASSLCQEGGMKVGLYGDLAVGVAGDSADLWADPSDYLHGLSFGSPPDAFNKQGQNWCMPPFNPLHLREVAYRPYIEMLRDNMGAYGALRLDHVMWLARMFVIPSGKPASSGTFLRFPLDDLLAILALESTKTQTVIIGEDLGTVPLGFRERMEQENILSYRLMRFEKNHDGSFKQPGTYPYLSLATPSSHDLPTLRGFLQGEDIALNFSLGFIKNQDELDEALDNRKYECTNLVNALKAEGLWSDQETDDISEQRESNSRTDEQVAAIHLFLARANAAITMFNLEDFAGSKHQINVPGTVDEVPNWRHRLEFDPSDLIQDEDLRVLLELVQSERKRLPV